MAITIIAVMLQSCGTSSSSSSKYVGKWKANYREYFASGEKSVEMRLCIFDNGSVSGTEIAPHYVKKWSGSWYLEGGNCVCSLDSDDGYASTITLSPNGYEQDGRNRHFSKVSSNPSQSDSDASSIDARNAQSLRENDEWRERERKRKEWNDMIDKSEQRGQHPVFDKY